MSFDRTAYGGRSTSRVCRAWHESSRVQVYVEPKVSQRASASSRGGVRRKSKAKSRGDEQEPDMRRDAFGTSGHVTAKSSIYSVGGDTNKGAFCKSGAYARKDSSLTTGDLRGVSGQPGTGHWETGAELPRRSQQRA